MTAVLETQRDALERFRHPIEKALAFGGKTHGFEHVVQGVESGALQSWVGVASVVITEIVRNPIGTTDLHFFLAAGNEAELKTMHPMILEWGRTQGCTRATIIGRAGWSRSWLVRNLGWVPTLICFEKEV